MHYPRSHRAYRNLRSCCCPTSTDIRGAGPEKSCGRLHRSATTASARGKVDHPMRRVHDTCDAITNSACCRLQSSERAIFINSSAQIFSSIFIENPVVKINSDACDHGEQRTSSVPHLAALGLLHDVSEPRYFGRFF